MDWRMENIERSKQKKNRKDTREDRRRGRGDQREAEKR